MRYFDYHTHSSFSYDGKDSPEQMVEEAVNQGLSEIAITDHFEILDPNEDPFIYLDIPKYFASLSELEERYAENIRVIKGIELTIQPGKINELNDQVLQEYPFDFVIASVHIANGQWIDQKEYLDPRSYKEALTDYYDELLEDVRTFKNYDVIGHINGIDRYISRVPTRDEYQQYAEPIVIKILKELIADGKGIEINTSSYRYGLGTHTTPTQDILDLYASLGGTIITVGSDAHIVSGVGDHLGAGYEQIKKAGLSSFTTFKDRHPTQIAISESISIT
jgi:histidinol-phosphatase (PHP family)